MYNDVQIDSFKYLYKLYLRNAGSTASGHSYLVVFFFLDKEEINFDDFRPTHSLNLPWNDLLVQSINQPPICICIVPLPIYSFARSTTIQLGLNNYLN